MVYKLPAEYLSRIKEQFSDEYGDFLKSYEKKARRSIRINTLKTNNKDFTAQAPFNMEPVPWVKNGFYLEDGADPAGCLLYRCGLYYIQEASAMAPADRLPINEGDKVLDLCAAPGGKATALAAKLKGTGLLVANEPSAARCRTLLHNLELAGAGNIIVTNEQPYRLEERFPEFFDKILVDAPCSGEGMFRKNPEVADSWTPKRSLEFAKLQKSILKSAAAMLKKGGYLMYSTCTFSPSENEENVKYMLDLYPQLELVDIDGSEYFAQGDPKFAGGDQRIRKTVRLLPHKVECEGHFLALFKKKGEEKLLEDRDEAKARNKKKTRAGLASSFNEEERYVLEEYLKAYDAGFDRHYLYNRNGRVYFIPFNPRCADGLRVLRCGLYMGELKKKRFEPSQAAALYFDAPGFKNTLLFEASDERVRKYLNNENIVLGPAEESLKDGLVLIKIASYSLGFGKKIGNIIKSKYLWLR